MFLEGRRNLIVLQSVKHFTSSCIINQWIKTIIILTSINKGILTVLSITYPYSYS